MRFPGPPDQSCEGVPRWPPPGAELRAHARRRAGADEQVRARLARTARHAIPVEVALTWIMRKIASFGDAVGVRAPR